MSNSKKAVNSVEEGGKNQAVKEQRWQLKNGQNIIGTCPTSDRQMQYTTT